MIIKTGIDIISIKRIKAAYDSKGQNFINRILTKQEQAYCIKSDIVNLNKVAKRFAAKEAFSKCLGSGIGYVSFVDIEILNNKDGAPYINVSNKLDDYLKNNKNWYNYSIDVSLSDDNNMATAIVIIYSQKSNSIKE